MEDERRKIWSKLLAQAIGPLREFLQDSSFPLVAPGSAAERELDDARRETADKRQELLQLATRITELEINVGKRLEEFEIAAGKWGAAAQATAELEMVLCKEKLQHAQTFMNKHSITARPSDVASSQLPQPAESTQPRGPQKDVGEGRGRDRVPQGARQRHHSPLMLPVLWGYQRDAPTGMIPVDVLLEHQSGPNPCIIRRTSPNQFPVHRLVAPNLEALQPYRPRTGPP